MILIIILLIIFLIILMLMFSMIGFWGTIITFSILIVLYFATPFLLKLLWMKITGGNRG